MVDKTKRLIFVSALAFSLMTASIYGAHQALAVDNTTHTTLVQMIADKFSLKTSDVQAVFTQAREQRQQEMEQLLEKRLSDAVTSGKITDAQKQLILAKHEELQKAREADLTNWQSLTPEQRKAKRDAERTDLETWAKANNIDLSYLMPRFGTGGGRMGRGTRGDFH